MKLLMACGVGMGLAIMVSLGAPNLLPRANTSSAAAVAPRIDGDNGATGIGNRSGRDGGTGGGPLLADRRQSGKP